MGTSGSVFLLLSLAGFMALSSCEPKKEPAAQAARPAEDRPELEMDRVDLKSYVDGEVSWHLRAPLAQGYTSLQFMKAIDMTMTFYKQGEKSTELRSDEGFIKTDSQSSPGASAPTSFSKGKVFEPGDMYLDGNVVVTSTEGVRMETDWLWYHKKRELITSTAPVKVVRSDSITTGTGMEANADLSEIKIFDQTVIIRDDEEAGQ